ncbi:kinase-like domain-containing protein [Crucibulum laeve]|uniref:Kinase-like domain-containing protein n=1 Tax=Crucibulum laeve TaxID=68775 RepID=A0A5C3MIT3_9AGAR|nr:kinase-like domain-containing protein [Crucibulum laeve]
MLSAPAYEFTFDDDDWTPPTQPPRLYRAASVGSWGVTSMGRGFDWNLKDNDSRRDPTNTDPPAKKLETIHSSPHEDLQFHPKSEDIHPRKHNHAFLEKLPIARLPHTLHRVHTTPNMLSPSPIIATQSYSQSPAQSPSSSPHIGPFRPPSSHSPSSPRPRRRSSQQRVSLIAGRVSIAPIEPPSPPPILPQSLRRTGSSGSFLSVAASTRAPSPATENESFLGGPNISDYEIEGEIGRGAYGLVKRGREIRADGSLGPPLVIKQVIKSRILADCWKKHPKHGTIPIEIYVMSAISNTSYVLPPRRPWDPARLKPKKSQSTPDKPEDDWVEGKVVKGHPNICPLLDFFEDQNYYYLVLPSTTPEHVPNEPPPPSDLFDLVEAFPQGLPPSSIRNYLGQIADALCFLHSHGIVHRDVKDENVVLGPDGKCILIDFGSSGLVKKSGWDTFSGTLDYAGPEILRGERYYGKEQDVWAFGVVGYVLLVGECPFVTPAEAQDGFQSPFANAAISLDERCAEGKEQEGEEEDGGGALGDAAALVRACLQVEVSARPTFEKILQCRFLAGNGGWGMGSEDNP